MSKINFIIVAVLLYTTAAFTQTQSTWCGSSISMQNRLAVTPGYKALATQASMCNFCGTKVTGNNIYRINVSVHCIVSPHQDNNNSNPENVSDEDIFASIATLSETYRNLGPNGNSNGLDCEIEFCVKNITRHTSIDSEGHTWGTPALEQTIKQYGQDDPNQFLNIWVVRDIDGKTNAYATFPWDLALFPSNDGIVITVDNFNVRSGTNTTDGVDILAHEVGHWLGLFHTFERGVDHSESDCLNNNYQLNG